MLVEFRKPVSGTRYHSVLHRRDGLQIAFDGGGYNKVGGRPGRVPHDLAHFVVEDALGLDFGLWGVLAAGGMFDHTTVVAGRRPPHFARRSQAVVDRAGDRLSQAEVVTRAVADLALAGRPRDVDGLQRALGDRHRLGSVSPDDLEEACRRLREAAADWATLRPEGTLSVTWRLPEPRR